MAQEFDSLGAGPGVKALIDSGRAVEFFEHFNKSRFRIPATDDIKSIRVEINASRHGGGVGPCEIPSDSWDKLFVYFQHLEVDTAPVYAYDEAGSIKITLNNERVVRVSWYPVQGKGADFFCSVHGIRFRASKVTNVPEMLDKGMHFTGIIRELVARHVGTGKSGP